MLDVASLLALTELGVNDAAARVQLFAGGTVDVPAAPI